jgi:porphobilinogen deaminase
LRDGVLTLCGFVATPDGATRIAGEQYGGVHNAVEIGTALAESLLSIGADRILQSLGRPA